MFPLPRAMGRWYLFPIPSSLVPSDLRLQNGRRLIIGTRHGVIMLWNYINGQPLTDLRRIGGQDGGTEVSGCVHLVNKMQQLRSVPYRKGEGTQHRAVCAAPL